MYDSSRVGSMSVACQSCLSACSELVCRIAAFTKACALCLSDSLASHIRHGASSHSKAVAAAIPLTIRRQGISTSETPSRYDDSFLIREMISELGTNTVRL